ncbi:MAG TPA: penicillin-binding protein 2 [Candidatus Limnocylindrales bacterium]|nr:penicillin-binding protein 2 [Candidatus Limnocylindrales bacterium]
MNDSLLSPHRERDRRPIRFLVFGIVTILVFGLLTTRLAYLQINSGPQLAAQAEAQRTAEKPIPATRGLIYDRQGRLLVQNVATWAVKVTPSELPFGQRDMVARRLGSMLGIEATEILTTLDSAPGSRFDPVRVAQDVPEDTARLVAESSDELPGVTVVVETRREYPDGPLLAHILGYTGPIDEGTYARLRSQGYLSDDMIGKTGVESTFESELRGTYGIQIVEKDATGKEVQVLASEQDAVPGGSLTLTIDRTIQREATQALKWGMKAAGLKRGVFIVMNPQTGEVLALVSLPSYDNNLFARGISTKAFQKLLNDKNKPLTNHAVQAHYPPGSTYKLVAGTGGLADKKLTAKTKLRTKAYLTLSGIRFYDWNRRGFGACDLNCGFGHSSDTYFFQVAGMLGADRLAYWARMYGFGKPTGIDLPGEAAGIVPSNQWKVDALGQPMFGGEVYQAGIGQGYDVVTPIQLINAYAALANGGKVYRPQIVKDVIGPDGTVITPFKPDLIRKMPVPQRVFREMRLAGRSTVTLRHTYNLVDMPVKVAGKSGTAEFGTRDAKGRLPFHSWFVGFVPKNPYKADFSKPDSELVFLAFAYDSRTKGNAGTEIAKAFLQLHFHIKKDYLNRDLLRRGNFYQSN